MLDEPQSRCIRSSPHCLRLRHTHSRLAALGRSLRTRSRITARSRSLRTRRRLLHAVTHTAPVAASLHAVARSAPVAEILHAVTRAALIADLLHSRMLAHLPHIVRSLHNYLINNKTKPYFSTSGELNLPADRSRRAPALVLPIRSTSHTCLAHTLLLGQLASLLARSHLARTRRPTRHVDTPPGSDKTNTDFVDAGKDILPSPPHRLATLGHLSHALSICLCPSHFQSAHHTGPPPGFQLSETAVFMLVLNNLWYHRATP